MKKSNIKNKAESAADAIKQSAETLINDPKGEMMESAKDWTKYIQTHPLQTMLFSLIGYFAVKGIFK